jgi:hypothetical protein
VVVGRAAPQQGGAELVTRTDYFIILFRLYWVVFLLSWVTGQKGDYPGNLMLSGIALSGGALSGVGIGGIDWTFGASFRGYSCHTCHEVAAAGLPP